MKRWSGGYKNFKLHYCSFKLIIFRNMVDPHVVEYFQQGTVFVFVFFRYP